MGCHSRWLGVSRAFPGPCAIDLEGSRRSNYAIYESVRGGVSRSVKAACWAKHSSRLKAFSSSFGLREGHGVTRASGE